MNSLSLNSNKSDSLAFSHAYFDDRVRKLGQVEEIVDLIRSGRIRYYDLGNFTKDGIEYMSRIDKITYIYNDDTLQKSFPRETGFRSQESLLEDLEAYLLEEQEFVADLAGFVRGELYEIEVSSKLTAMEAQILTRKNEVDSLYLSHEAISDDEQEMFLAIYRTFLEERFDDFSKEYAGEATFEAKVEKGELLLDLLAELEKRFPALTGLYSRNLEIDELYMEETFNPFTYTRYDVRAKERLFESGAVRLFNHYVDELKEEEDYTQIKDHVSNIEKLQERKLQEKRKALQKRLERMKTC
jgi:predicted ribosome quality control (RQC) complex YloA/Tae2 family protein